MEKNQSSNRMTNGNGPVNQPKDQSCIVNSPASHSIPKNPFKRVKSAPGKGK